MSTNNDMIMVDADAHVLEPATLWQDYIEPKYRDRAIRIDIDDNGLEIMMVDNKPYESMRGSLAGLGGIEMDNDMLLKPGAMTYAQGCPIGSNDPVERIQVMNSEGIDISLLYPTIGISWEAEVQDPALATAYTNAYNRWLGDFCSHDRKRLVPIAHISLIDPEGAVKEVIRCKKEGFVGVYLSPDPASRAGRHFHDPVFAPFWETVQELEMPIGFHVIVRQRPTNKEWLTRTRADGLFTFSWLAMDVIAAFTMMISQGILEKYPRLKCVVLESGASWIAYWMDRMDNKYQVMTKSPITMPPSEYFRRQCLISADPDESMTASVVEKMGADHFTWASDYPHIDAAMGVVAEIKRKLSPLPLEDQRKVYGTNALKFYGLDA